MKKTVRTTVENSSRYFLNYACEYFPCHQTDAEDFNCLFCYCPMYYLECLGTPHYITLPTGRVIKDCSGCIFPHRPENYETILEYLTMVATGEVLDG
ncbi:MAG: metal-binding protein [Nitrospirae bacterium]|nr:MAG: metal-binding protein [Nitrospirota bacterium]